ncbi:hypothetical protein [uncultured Coprobacter sp.]|uniref:hypothetical protein n=1 Tax=uncultured Coprobacter sp. TaxID=1720550 RepID=UPI0026177792|nr:hypothetical protein [uncultured Coprobacter sp.]
MDLAKLSCKYLLINVLLLLLNSCNDVYKNDIENLRSELILQKQLLSAIQNNLSITDISKEQDGYTIVFSNGESVTIENGKSSLITIGENGNWFIDGIDTGKSSKGDDGINAPNIINMVWKDNVLTFYFSDDSVISVPVNIEQYLADPISPNKIYTVCNDLNLERMVAAQLYLDHMFLLNKHYCLSFAETSDNKYPFISSIDGKNGGSDVFVSDRDIKIKGCKTLSIKVKHVSVKASVGRNRKIRILPIGDSVGVGYGGQWNVMNGRPTVSWAIVQQMFALDRIDAQASSDEFSLQLVGTRGKKEYSNFYNNEQYKFVTYNECRGGWALATYLYKAREEGVNPFYDESVSGENKFSLRSFLSRYRTHDDSGVQLNKLSPELGSMVCFDSQSDYINTGVLNISDIYVNTPTHVVIQLGFNDLVEGYREQYIENMKAIIYRIKEQYPDMIIGISLPDAFGSYFPEFYPGYEFSAGMSLYNDFLHQKVYEWTPQLMALEDVENKVFYIPNYFIQPAAEGVPHAVVETADGSTIKINTYDTSHYHPNNIAHYAWGYQIYAWLKYTLTLSE